jgi:hypothetical protein
MFRATALAGIAALTLRVASAQNAAPPTISPTVGVYMNFEAAPVGTALEFMQREVDKLLEPAGVKVNWRLTRDNRGDEAYSRLMVLKFIGACRADWSVQARVDDEAAAVGDTEVAEGQVLPFSEVRCDVVRRALSYLAPATSKEQRQEALGVAMGRIVAHELYHVLARTTLHAEKGLAKASQTLRDLVSKQAIVFGEHDAEAIRKGFESATN